MNVTGISAGGQHTYSSPFPLCSPVGGLSSVQGTIGRSGPWVGKSQQADRPKPKVVERKLEAKTMGQTAGGYVPQMLIASPPANRHEPVLFTFVLLLHDVPLVPHTLGVWHAIGAPCCDPSFLRC
jgi:hypothetical protein